VTSAEKGEKKKAKKRPGESEQTAEGVDKPSKKLKKPEMEENVILLIGYTHDLMILISGIYLY